MYQLIEQPVARLSPGTRLILWATRGWVSALTAKGCPPGALAPAFLHCQAIEALPHFHRLMIAFNHRALETLRVAPLPHPTITEWEALVLQLWIDAQADPLNARATLALLLEDEAVEPAFEALMSASARLTAVCLAVDGLTSPQCTPR